MTLREEIKKKFARLNDQQLIDRANKAPDFGWDDEAFEIERRHTENGLQVQMQGNRLVIMEAVCHN
jgi:hypothetical protein